MISRDGSVSKASNFKSRLCGFPAGHEAFRVLLVVQIACDVPNRHKKHRMTAAPVTYGATTAMATTWSFRARNISALLRRYDRESQQALRLANTVPPSVQVPLCLLPSITPWKLMKSLTCLRSSQTSLRTTNEIEGNSCPAASLCRSLDLYMKFPFGNKNSRAPRNLGIAEDSFSQSEAARKRGGLTLPHRVGEGDDSRGGAEPSWCHVEASTTDVCRLTSLHALLEGRSLEGGD